MSRLEELEERWRYCLALGATLALLPLLLGIVAAITGTATAPGGQP